MDAAELREMSDEQLELELKNTTESLFRLRIQAQTERLDAPSELRRHRRLVACIKTIQAERDLGSSLNVSAQFVRRSNGTPLTGSEYRAKLFDKNVFVKDPIVEAELDKNGQVRFTCNLKDENQRESFAKLFKEQPQVYIVLEKDSKAVFRSSPHAIRRKRERAAVKLGTFKV